MSYDVTQCHIDAHAMQCHVNCNVRDKLFYWINVNVCLEIVEAHCYVVITTELVLSIYNYTLYIIHIQQILSRINQ